MNTARYIHFLISTLANWYQSSDSETTMSETQSTAMTNEAIASLQATSDLHSKDIQDIQKIQEIHTRTLNKMEQHLTTILQKLSSDDEPRARSSQENSPPILDFPRFSGEDPASRVYKAKQYFGITKPQM